MRTPTDFTIILNPGGRATRDFLLCFIPGARTIAAPQEPLVAVVTCSSGSTCHRAFPSIGLELLLFGGPETLPPGSHPWCALSLQGAFWGLLFGLVVGLLRMILEFCYPAPACGEEDRRPAVLKEFHYLYFALLLCGLTAIVIVAVSLCTAPIPEEKASGVLGVRPHAPLSQCLEFHH